MPLTNQIKLVSPVLNRALGATITASVATLNDIETMLDPRVGLWTIFDDSTVDIDFDLGPFAPYNIDFISIRLPRLSAAGIIVVQSKAAAIDSYVTVDTIQLFTQLTTDGADGFGADERGADEYAAPTVRKYPANPIYYLLLATQVDHRYWRIQVTDDGGVARVYASVPAFAEMWQVPTNYGVTGGADRLLDDQTTRTINKSGASSVHPGEQRLSLGFDMEHFEAAEAFETLAWMLEEHGTRDPWFAMLRCPATGSNVKNDQTAAGYAFLRNMTYGNFERMPQTRTVAEGTLSGRVNLRGFLIKEAL